MMIINDLELDYYISSLRILMMHSCVCVLSLNALFSVN